MYGWFMYVHNQARSQGTFEVEAPSGRGILHIYSAVFYIRKDPYFNFLSMILLHDFTCKTIPVAFQYCSNRNGPS